MSSLTGVTSSLRAATMRGGKTMTVDRTQIGRWLGDACPLKDNEIQQVP